jgi:4-hydroxybenzoate polyprenyltransferase/phosphoglycolate phosphatase-like HAD superfamily hydrolase
MSAAQVSVPSGEYLVVDLDGTLVLTDTFAACVLEALRKRFSSLPAVIAGLMRGRAVSKRIAASLAKLNVESLPYNEPLIEYLREQKAAGRRLILATGADVTIAAEVAAHLGIFDEVIASDGTRNMTGEEKVRAIEERTGGAPFMYAGNSRADLRVWRRSQAAILVATPRSCARELRAAGIAVQREFGSARSAWRAWARCLRVHQWSKNVLVFVPVLLAHQIGNPAAMWHALMACLALSFAASALYIINDLLDLQADRLHPAKRRRPLASGAVSMEAGLGLAAFMAVAAAAVALFLAPTGRLLLATYAAASLTYSLKLKRMLFLDVVSLSLLYALRVVYGGSATGISISVWTLAFSLFLFTSLATVKRLAELRRVSPAAGSQEYRGYMGADVNQLSSLASAAGCVAVLVLALYINSPEVGLLYRRPRGLWLLCPLLIYWIGRLTLIANRGHLDDDPVMFALKDRATRVIGVVAAMVLALST